MACRDCVWWTITEPRGLYEAVGTCDWQCPVPLPAIHFECRGGQIQESYGEGCPQFKERKDGE